MDEQLWDAIVNCKATFDGRYYYGVITTGIYCRPSCRSRTPSRENVLVFGSISEAAAHGFRPCKRCCPDDDSQGPDAALIELAKKIIEQRYQDALTLKVLARELAISPYHLHRTFKRLTGTTPAGYVLAIRLQAAKAALRSEATKSVTDAARTAGFRSATHFSTMFRQKTGYSPSRYRAAHITNANREEELR